MKLRAVSFWSFQCSVLAFFLLSLPAKAQIVPDTTLPNNSLITTQGNNILIERGTLAGSNLFHSFEKFSLPAGITAKFDNPLDIQNIITRVTGGSISNIDGLIRANGTANLFLVNPNGIVFGQNARLDIGGSFLATTANSIKFTDGLEFSAKNPQSTPLLTINTPIGLQFDSDSGVIEIKGTGQGIIAQSQIQTPYIRNNNLTGLSVKPGKNLALVGSPVNIEGATLTAEQGRIDIGSVEEGVVTLNSQEWNLGYEKVASFHDINLSQKALIDTSGNSSGSVAFQGKNISLLGGSVVLNQNSGSSSSGSININATESLGVNGTSPDGKMNSALQTESLNSGSSGDINISTTRLRIQDGANIRTRTYSTANGGNITIDAPESIQLVGFSFSNPSIASGIITSTPVSSGTAGDIKISTGKLLAQDGGLITSLSTASGSSGSVVVNASDSIQLINSGRNYIPSYVSSISSGTGNAGSLTINTSRLLVGNRAIIGTSIRGFGDAGTVTINADNIEISGSVASSASRANVDAQKLFGAPPVPTGSPGEVKINTRHLSLKDGGLVSVKNEGAGNGGMIAINAGSIFLDNKVAITAATASGKGGNIFLNAQDLQLRRGSTITATAGNRGDGGNITINTDTLAALEKSSITANAFEGRGGNIQINATGVFVSPDSRITASSERGIDGTVKINSPEANFSKAATAVPTQTDIPKVGAICGQYSDAATGEFTIIGKGGLMPNPLDEPIDPTTGWHDPTPGTSTEPLQVKPSEQEYVEAQGWAWNPDGTVRLTTEPIPEDVHETRHTSSPCNQIRGQVR